MSTLSPLPLIFGSMSSNSWNFPVGESSDIVGAFKFAELIVIGVVIDDCSNGCLLANIVEKKCLSSLAQK